MSTPTLLEHLPNVHLHNATQGVVLVVFSDGRVFFYPLNDEVRGVRRGKKRPHPLRVCSQTKDRTYQNATLLNNSPPTKQSAARSAKTERYFVYDACLELSARFQVTSFAFSRDLGDKTVLERPRKLLLSPNKQLLLVLGAYHNDRKCLLVYQILDTAPDPFWLIFVDNAFAFVDACFSPDSRSLVVIPTRHPHYLFVLDLPLIECPHNKPHEASNSLFLSASAKKNLEHHLHTRDTPTSFEPRAAGPLQVLGPCLSVTGTALAMTNVAGSHDPGEKAFHYITWGDGTIGEYCLWKTLTDPTSGRRRYHHHARLLNPDVQDFAWMAAADSPKTRIVGACFSEAPLSRVVLTVKRERYGRASDNGIGVQTFDLSASVDLFRGVWFQVSESLDMDEVLCVKWTQPLLLGKDVSVGILARRKGLFEVVAHRYVSGFQLTNEVFVSKCANWVQVGKFHRYWITHDGELRAFVVTPSVRPHPPLLALTTHQLISSRSRRRIPIGRRCVVVRARWTWWPCVRWDAASAITFRMRPVL